VSFLVACETKKAVDVLWKGVRLSCGSANIRSARDTDGHKTDTGFHVRVLQCNVMCSMSYVKLLNLSQKKKPFILGGRTHSGTASELLRIRIGSRHA
jgi:hypothetical protein